MIFNFIFPLGVGILLLQIFPARPSSAAEGQSSSAVPAVKEGAPTSSAALAQEDRIAELERTVATLAEELARTRAELAVPEDEASLTSHHGYGPAASKVYERDRGLSIGGYGEAFYTAGKEVTETRTAEQDAGFRAAQDLAARVVERLLEGL